MNTRALSLAFMLFLNFLTSFESAAECNSYTDQYPNYDAPTGPCGPESPLANRCPGGAVYQRNLNYCWANSPSNYPNNCEGNTTFPDGAETTRNGYIYYMFWENPKESEPVVYGGKTFYPVHYDYAEYMYCKDRKQTDFPPDYNHESEPDDETQGCEVGPHSFQISQTGNCSDYCETPNTNRITNMVTGNSNATDSSIVARCSDLSSDLQGKQASSTGPTDGTWDCEQNLFMCSYDTNKDGELSDLDDQYEWPSDRTSLEAGCTLSPASCDAIEEFYGEDVNNDGKIGGSSGGLSGSGNPYGNTNPQYGGDPSNPKIGDSSSATSIDSTTGELASECDSYSSCKTWAFRQYADCRDGTRDMFYFTYNSPTDFTSECHACLGPDYRTFSQCGNDFCPNGYNPETQLCWSENCPFGDCANPDDQASTYEVPIPPEPEQKQDSTEKSEALLTDINRSVNDVEVAINQQTLDIQNSIDNLKSSNQSGTSEITSRLDTINNTLKDGVPTDGTGEQTDLTALINEIGELTSESRKQTCIMQGYEDADSEGNCIGDNQPNIDMTATNEKLDQIPSRIEETAAMGELSKLKNISLPVSSQCGGAFIYEVPIKIGSIVNKTYTVDLCRWIEPVADFIRIMSLMFWALLSIRIFFEA
jgi:hypothetical protein